MMRSAHQQIDREPARGENDLAGDRTRSDHVSVDIRCAEVAGDRLEKVLGLDDQTVVGGKRHRLRVGRGAVTSRTVSSPFMP